MNIKKCECGCGGVSPVAKRTNATRGWIKGKPLRFIHGHNGRLRASGIIQYNVDPETGCWIWARSIQSNGYGHLTVSNVQVLAHRYVYEKHKGGIPDGLELDHLCKNPSCVNPEHLEPVTHAENCRRGKCAKLNKELIAKIKEMHINKHASISSLARKFNVSRRAIRAAIKEESWT